MVLSVPLGLLLTARRRQQPFLRPCSTPTTVRWRAVPAVVAFIVGSGDCDALY